MEESSRELKLVLQTLALPVIGQVHLLQDDCTRVEKLSRAFSAAHQAVQSDGGRQLTTGQSGVLTRLDDRLAQVGGQSPLPICSELSMRQSVEWRQIRTMAREALVHFNWTLAVPPHGVIDGNQYLN